TAAGTRRRAGSAPLGALCFPLVIPAGAVLVLGVLGLDKSRRLQAFENLVDVVVDLGDLQVLQRLSRRPAAIGGVGQARDQGLPDDVESNVALAQDLEKALTEPLIELRQRVKVVPQLIRLATDFDGHIAPMLVSHRIPPSNGRGGAV